MVGVSESGVAAPHTGAQAPGGLIRGETCPISWTLPYSCRAEGLAQGEMDI